jgi:hypothetical protein
MIARLQPTTDRGLVARILIAEVALEKPLFSRDAQNLLHSLSCPVRLVLVPHEAPKQRVQLIALPRTPLVSVWPGLAFGLAPAIQATQTDLAGSMKEGARMCRIFREFVMWRSRPLCPCKAGATECHFRLQTSQPSIVQIGRPASSK